jgi:hypothetical protein
MSLEPIGLITIIVGLICLQLGQLATVTTFVVATLFGAASTIIFGSANIPPAHLLLVFVAFTMLTRQREVAGAVSALSLGKPGFWLMCLLLYGAISGFVMPRLLAGTIQIVPLGISEYADTGSTVPIGPVSSNFNQAVYLAADLFCFAIIVAIASTRAGFSAIANALLAYAVGNVLFALIDLGTYATGTQGILDFMRNVYALHNEEEVSGLKRIVGSFTEASAFARSTLGVLGFTGTLWLCGWRPALTGSLAAASLCLVVLSTSSMGLVSTPFIVLILYIIALVRYGFHPSRPYRSAALLCGPLLVLAAIVAAQLDDEATAAMGRYVDQVIFNKTGSGSGIERASWNTFGLQNFLDSYGLGVGLGTVRTSSFPVALLANVGIPGTIFYLLFIGSALGRGRGVPRTFPSDFRLAARAACLSLIIGDTFVASTVDQGLLFYVLAGIACAEPEQNMSDVPAQTL